MDGHIAGIADEIADILVREGIDYVQSKAVFTSARIKAGLRAPKERRAAPAGLTLKEQLRFIDAAYARNDPTGLIVQTLLATGTSVSELVALRAEHVILGEHMITIENSKGGKRREIPIHAEFARVLAMHVGQRRAEPLFISRETGRSGARGYTSQRIGQMVREIARGVGITKRICLHQLRHTMAARLLALGMDITDIQKFLEHEDIGATRLYAQTSVAELRRKFDQITDRAACDLLGAVRTRHGDIIGAFAADLLSADGRDLTWTADA